jgi:hypothetical protein
MRIYALPGRCGISAGTRAVAVNVTVMSSTQPGFLRVSAADEPGGATSTINYGAGKTRSDGAIVRLDGSSRMAISCSQGAGTVQVVVDVTGYFAP